MNSRRGAASPAGQKPGLPGEAHTRRVIGAERA